MTALGLLLGGVGFWMSYRQNPGYLEGDEEDLCRLYEEHDEDFEDALDELEISEAAHMGCNLKDLAKPNPIQLSDLSGKELLSMHFSPRINSSPACAHVVMEKTGRICVIAKEDLCLISWGF